MAVMPLPDQLIVTRKTRPVLLRRDTVAAGFDLDVCLENACGRTMCPCGIAPSLLDLCTGRMSVLQIAAVLAQCASKPIGQILADIVPELQLLADDGKVQASTGDAINGDNETMRPF
jgi:hypothetical protein